MIKPPDNKSIGCGLPSGSVRRGDRRVVADGDTPRSARLTVAARAPSGLRPAVPRSTAYSGKLVILTAFCCAWFVCMAAGGSVRANPTGRSERAPGNLVAGEPSRGRELDAVLARVRIDRMTCSFHEEKHIALLAKPVRSTGTIYFARDKGVVRKTLEPSSAEVVVTTTTLKTRRGTRTETIPLGKSKQLKAFALVFPTVLRGQRAELERDFALGLYGSEKGWWALSFVPRDEALRAVVQRVLVVGRSDRVVQLQVSEASGDRTDTFLSDIATAGEVSDAAIATAFGDL